MNQSLARSRCAGVEGWSLAAAAEGRHSVAGLRTLKETGIDRAGHLLPPDRGVRARLAPLHEADPMSLPRDLHSVTRCSSGMGSRGASTIDGSRVQSFPGKPSVVAAPFYTAIRPNAPFPVHGPHQEPSTALRAVNGRTLRLYLRAGGPHGHVHGLHQWADTQRPEADQDPRSLEGPLPRVSRDRASRRVGVLALRQAARAAHRVPRAFRPRCAIARPASRKTSAAPETTPLACTSVPKPAPLAALATPSSPKAPRTSIRRTSYVPSTATARHPQRITEAKSRPSPMPRVYRQEPPFPVAHVPTSHPSRKAPTAQALAAPADLTTSATQRLITTCTGSLVALAESQLPRPKVTRASIGSYSHSLAVVHAELSPAHTKRVTTAPANEPDVRSTYRADLREMGVGVEMHCGALTARGTHHLLAEKI